MNSSTPSTECVIDELNVVDDVFLPKYACCELQKNFFVEQKTVNCSTK